MGFGGIIYLSWTDVDCMCSADGGVPVVDIAASA